MRPLFQPDIKPMGNTVDYKQLLFFHLNSYWIYKYLNPRGNPENFPRNAELYDRLGRLGETHLFSEGYELGEHIFRHSLPGQEGFSPEGSWPSYLEERYPGYAEFVARKIHAWAVPLSYRDFDRTLDHPADQYYFDKRLNLWGSTAAHDAYFEKLVPVVSRYISGLEPGERPRGFIDIGCGDGALLRRVRASMQQLPDDFLYIGVDIDRVSNQIALEQDSTGIVYLQGDVSAPDTLNRKLLEAGYPSLDSFFNLRAFVDHNFNPVVEHTTADQQSGYTYRKGSEMVTEQSVLAAYLNHFRAWKPYISRYGVGLIELHRTVGSSLYESPSPAYEIFHFLSGQYMVTHAQFKSQIQSADWHIKEQIYLVPEMEPTVSIGIYR